MGGEYILMWLCVLVSFLRSSATAIGKIGLRWSNYAWTFNTRHDLNARNRSRGFGSVYIRFR
jgi:hypothetical protein